MGWTMRRQTCFALALVFLIAAAPTLAQDWRQRGAENGKDRMPGGAPGAVACAIGRWQNCDIKQAIDRGLFETGLSPTFPTQANCREIDDGYAINYASKRKGREQFHGGIDMPAPSGTPMIAAAAGTVVGKFQGEHSFRGIEIVLRHAPEDTGIPLWIYTQYGHCLEMPALQPG